MGILGTISPSPKGAWSVSSEYQSADIVRHGNTAYIALQSSTGVEPRVSTGWNSYWMPIIADGDQSELQRISDTINAVAPIVNMTVSATSLEYTENATVNFQKDLEGNASLTFGIPHLGSPPEPSVPVFYLNAGSWEVLEIVGTGGASYTSTSLGVQDFSNLEYNFEEGMTWNDFRSSAHNVVVGGQFGGVPDTMSLGWYATTGRKFAPIVYFDFGSGEDIQTLCFAKHGDTVEDQWSRPTEIEIYLDGNPVSPTDLIIPGAHYVVGQN